MQQTTQVSEWVSKHVKIGSGVSLDYNLVPYMREWLENQGPESDVEVQVIKHATHMGVQSGFIFPTLLWGIVNDPCAMIWSVPNGDMVDLSVDGVVRCAKRSGLFDKMMPGKNSISFDGDQSLRVVDMAKAHQIRVLSAKRVFCTDVDVMPYDYADLFGLVCTRSAPYGHSAKVNFIGLPSKRRKSNIDGLYMLGDRRKYMLPCPCCSELIDLVWTKKGGAGIVYNTDNHGKLIDSSVGYVCQKCSGHFTEKDKLPAMQEGGVWSATSTPSRQKITSYTIGALYAMPEMKTWGECVRDWLSAHPVGAPVSVPHEQVFYNAVLAEVYGPEDEVKF